MKTGTLDPNDYGGYMVQDAAYCFSAVAAFNTAAQKMQGRNPEFSLLYRVQSESFRSYNQEFVNTWRLKSTDSILMGPAAAMYVGYESALSQQDAKNLCIGMLPCAMLWPWIARELIDEVAEDNPYYVWFQDNYSPPGDKSSLEKFVDNFFTEEASNPEENEKLLNIFQEGLVNELNFFRDACDETLYYYSDFNM